MARIITKELAEKIVAKLGATRTRSMKGRHPHDTYIFRHGGRIISRVNIRHGSNRQQGHDFIPSAMRISPNEARLFAQCEHSLE